MLSNKWFQCIYRFGTEANMIWPRIIAPLLQSASGFVPKTKATLGYEFSKPN
jgi:hypothetical protein